MLLGWLALTSCQPQQMVIHSDLTVKAAPGSSRPVERHGRGVPETRTLPERRKDSTARGALLRRAVLSRRSAGPGRKGHGCCQRSRHGDALLQRIAWHGGDMACHAPRPGPRDVPPERWGDPRRGPEAHEARKRPRHRGRTAVLLAVRLERLRPRAAAMSGGRIGFRMSRGLRRHAGHGAHEECLRALGRHARTGAPDGLRVLDCRFLPARRCPQGLGPHDRSTNGYAVADAFIEGFREGHEGTAPLASPWQCQRGTNTPSRRTRSPHRQALRGSHYHVQYPAPFRSASQPARPAETGAPLWRPSTG